VDKVGCEGLRWEMGGLVRRYWAKKEWVAKEGNGWIRRMRVVKA
jgi:hypothetical protein